MEKREEGGRGGGRKMRGGVKIQVYVRGTGNCCSEEEKGKMKGHC